MSLFYYIASTRELPVGSFGKNKTVVTLEAYLREISPSSRDNPYIQTLLDKHPNGDVLVDIYDSEEDAAGIYVSGPFLFPDPPPPFRNPYIYQIDPDGGSFRMDIAQQHTGSTTSNRTGKKCLTELFSYLERNMEYGEEVELYSCWADGSERFSDLPLLELNRVIGLNNFLLPEDFEWKQRQYILVRKI